MSLTIEHADFRDFIAFLRLKNLSPKTITNYTQVLQDFFRSCPAEWSSFQEVTPQHLRTYVAGLQEKGRAPKTVADRVTILKRFFGYLASEQRISADPTQRLPIPKVGKRLPKALTLEETEAFFASLNGDSELEQRNRLLIGLMYAAGLRVSEAVGLRAENIDFGEGAIRVIGKGDNERRVYLKPDFVASLREYVQARHLTGWVFPGYRGQHLDLRTAELLVRQLAKKAGIQRRVTPHVFRHSIAVHYLQGGAPVNFVQGFLGHASLATTGKYLQLTDQMAKQIALKTETALDRIKFSEKERKTRERRGRFGTDSEFEMWDAYARDVLGWLTAKSRA